MIQRGLLFLAWLAAFQLIGAFSVTPAVAQDVLPPSYILVGDMLLDSARLVINGPDDPSLAAPAGVVPGTTSTFTRETWQNGIVPVQFDSDIDAAKRALFNATCQNWSQVANVQCVPRTTESVYVRVRIQQGCSSSVGRNTQSPNVLTLDAYCWDAYTIQHEQGHMFGLLHEHQRSDRDIYVIVNTGNIYPAALSAFELVSTGENRTPYDFLSVMHYWEGNSAIVIPQFSLIAKPGYEQFQHLMGRGNNRLPSLGDAVTMRQLYGAPAPPLAPAPPQLTAQQVTANPITLNWTPGGGGAPTSYAIHAGSEPGASNLGVFPMGLSTGITVNAPVGQRLYVRIVASNQYGTGTSNEISFTVDGVTEPGIPTLTPTQVTTNPITLDWSPGAGGAPQGYTLQAGTASGLANLGTFNMGLAKSISANAPVGMPLFLRVVARNAAGSATSKEVTFTVNPAPPPAPPVMQSPIVTGSTVQLAWSGPAAASYTLLARATPTGPVLISAPVGSITTLTVPSVGNGTYHVTAVANVGGQSSAESNQVVAVVMQ